MARWQSGARDRLQRAALELYAARGFDGVTVAEIAAAAELTERTFFRHFADKREVLFVSQVEFEAAFLGGVDSAPGEDPLAMVEAALAAAAELFPGERRPWSRARQAVIAANLALQERELLKLSSLATAITGTLVERGVDAITAALAAESGVTVFRTAFATWIGPGEERPFAEVQGAVLAELHALLGRPAR